MPKFVLGIDPGFAHLGLSIYQPSTCSVKAWTVVETEKSKNKTLLAREDNVDRFSTWAKGFISFVDPYLPHIVAVCSEGMSQPRAAGAAAKLFMSWGGILMWSHERNLPFFQVSPQELKKFFCGKKDASKDEMIAALKGYPVNLPAWATRKTLHEHQADAACSSIALVARVPALQLATRDP